MIHIYGTSHVSEDSIELIDRKIEEHSPDIVALELDMMRLNSLVTDKKSGQLPLFGRLIKYFQERIGKKTGVMPGDEMLHAYRMAEENDYEVALIDQDVRITMQRLKDVRRKEKVKAALSLFGGFLLPGSFDIGSIPEDETIDELLEQVKYSYPEIYRVLIEERNRYMVEALKHLQKDNPGKEIVVFVGAGHKEEMRKMLENRDQRSLADF